MKRIKATDDYYPHIDRIFRLPRVWSNRELSRFAALFQGDVVNVSGWKDADKEGGIYKNYFVNASSYTITNFKSDARGFQGMDNEIFLDLTQPLPQDLIGKFDVVFNHTVLEHIYEIHQAFKNLCLMSRDVVIVVVPFLQEMHADYGDYWRFTPQTIKNLFEENELHMQYCSFNSHKNASVYLFCIGVKASDSWKGKIPRQVSQEDPFPANNGFENWVGCHAIQNQAYVNNKGRKNWLKKKLKRLF